MRCKAGQLVFSRDERFAEFSAQMDVKIQNPEDTRKGHPYNTRVCGGNKEKDTCLGECIHRLSVGLLFLVYQGEAEVVLQSQLLVGVLVDNGHLLALVVIVLDAVSDLGRKILEIHVALLLRVNVLQQLLYFVVAHYIGVPDCRNQILVIDVS